MCIYTSWDDKSKMCNFALFSGTIKNSHIQASTEGLIEREEEFIFPNKNLSYFCIYPMKIYFEYKYNHNFFSKFTWYFCLKIPLHKWAHW